MFVTVEEVDDPHHLPPLCLVVLGVQAVDDGQNSLDFPLLLDGLVVVAGQEQKGVVVEDVEVESGFHLHADDEVGILHPSRRIAGRVELADPLEHVGAPHRTGVAKVILVRSTQIVGHERVCLLSQLVAGEGGPNGSDVRHLVEDVDHPIEGLLADLGLDGHGEEEGLPHLLGQVDATVEGIAPGPGRLVLLDDEITAEGPDDGTIHQLLAHESPIIRVLGVDADEESSNTSVDGSLGRHDRATVVVEGSDFAENVIAREHFLPHESRLCFG
ncbi:MAG: hypothetical protein COX80_03320 [Candidatus Magasanikbacteria bacterium CG_4_10_14_0_2_um_filter_33_14]|uniref:Uncharacterized protein n=1 Tax=Candidatus Magasanikbacteria bacterium CG_4_10_14_0_2_um_filter_33_14 TaxID=1974636 RepID=A0A2M7VA37_9BACT|nr:MAG: hypothetical protein COX80_03320 [Candidatus Magasanikbacteria bacterium CG_4_10_14_0_2_um_filter_33_14]